MRIELITICEEAEDEISNNDADRTVSKEIVEEALQKADELFEEKFSLLKHKIKCELEYLDYALKENTISKAEYNSMLRLCLEIKGIIDGSLN